MRTLERRPWPQMLPMLLLALPFPPALAAASVASSAAAPAAIGAIPPAGGPGATPLDLEPTEDTASPGDPGAIREVRAVRAVSGAPVIDGVLDDAAWRAADPATAFVQMNPSPGQPASRRTEARIAYDDQAIYVAFRLYDDPDSIAAQLSRRDASGVFSDWAHVLVDSYNDRRTAFRFSASPSGTKKDVLHYDDFSEDINWDAVWEVATLIDSLGWTAEFRIPLSQLRFSAVEGGDLTWGVNFGREIARLGEWSWWSPVRPEVGGIVSQSGTLTGIAGIEPGRRLEILPYSVASVTRAPPSAGNPFHTPTAATLDMGADLRYGLSSNFTLSATINPDFGQVEADPSVVNLSAFETFFPEKRPFFVEGSNIFAFGVGTDDGSGESLFYSRRIGRQPQRRPQAEHIDAPDATRIAGAAKLTGKTAGGWTLGLLNAVTARESALAHRDGETVEEAVEPLANHAVASVSRDFRDGRSSLGVMGTAVHRDLGEEDGFAFLRSAAYSGGIRGRHRFADDSWEANAYVVGSHIRGDTAAIDAVQRAAGHYFQRPDADHLQYDPDRTALTGGLLNWGVWKIGGSGLRGGVGGHVRTPGLELNDLGFQGEADQVQLFGNLRYQQFQPTGPFRSFNLGVNPFVMWTTGGERTFAQLGHWSNWELRSFWNGGWWVGLRPGGAVSTTQLRGGPAVVREPGVQGNVWLNSDRRKALRGNLSLGGGRERNSGAWNAFLSTGATFRPSARANVSFAPTLHRSHNPAQYVAQGVALGARQYIVGSLDLTTVSFTTRVNYTISPTLSLEVYAQPFVSGGEYDGFRRVVSPRAERFEERFETLRADQFAYEADSGRYRLDLDADGEADMSIGNPAFNFRQMRGNGVLRWEYRPGSTLFLVWSQSRTGFATGSPGDEMFAFGRDFGRLMNQDGDFPTPVTNVFLIKVSHWLNP